MADVYVSENDFDLTIEDKRKLDEFTDALEFIDNVETVTVITGHYFNRRSVWIEFDEKFIIIGLDELIGLLDNTPTSDVAMLIYEECMNIYSEQF